MRKPNIKIAVPALSYGELETLGQAVITAMTGNANFPAPTPSLATLQAARNVLSDAITAWGTEGHRGSRKDRANLGVACVVLRNLLLQEMSYVTNLVDLNATPEEQKSFLASSGFPIKNERSPQGILEQVQNFSQYISPAVPSFHVKLKWKRPLNMKSADNVRVYLIYRSLTGLPDDAVFLSASTTTSYIDESPVPGKKNSYFVVPFNNAGNGVTSNVVTVSVAEL